MRSYPRILLGLAALATAFVLSRDAEGFCRSTTCKGDTCARDDAGCKTTGIALFWRTACIGFSVQKNGTELIPMKYIEATVRKSFASWTDLGCDTGTATLSFSELPQVTCRRAEYNSGAANANIILFQDTKWNYSGVDNTLAKTTVTFDDTTGEILDADIEVNHAYNDITVSDDVVKYDLQSILTHEIGHFVGLDHSDDPSATMFASYDPGSIELRSIEPDDVAAACAAYPPERVAKCATAPRGGFADVCGGEPVGASGCTMASVGAPIGVPSEWPFLLVGLTTAFSMCRSRSKRLRTPRLALGARNAERAASCGMLGGELEER